MDLLRAVDGSVLWLLEGTQTAMRNLHRAAAAHSNSSIRQPMSAPRVRVRGDLGTTRTGRASQQPDDRGPVVRTRREQRTIFSRPRGEYSVRLPAERPSTDNSHSTTLPQTLGSL